MKQGLAMMLVTIISLTTIISILAPPTIAASTIWSTPNQLTTDLASDADPSIAHDSNGRIWVFFTSDRSGSPQIWYVASNDQGQTWSSPQLFPPTQTPSGAHYVAEACLFEDSQGRLWSAWGRWSGSSQEDIYWSFSDDMGATWSDSRLLVGYYDVDGQPSFVQVGNEIWLVFSSYGIAGNWNIYYIETSDGGQTWSSPRGIVVDQFRHDSCSVVEDSSGKVQVFYTTLTSPYDPTSADIWLVETSDQGGTWSIPKQVTSFPSEEGHISAVDFGGALYVFYMNRYEQDIWYVVSNDAGATWPSTPERVDSDSHSDQYPNVVVAEGKLWVTWSSDRSGNWDIWIAHARALDLLGLKTVISFESITTKRTLTNPLGAFTIQQNFEIALGRSVVHRYWAQNTILCWPVSQSYKVAIGIFEIYESYDAGQTWHRIIPWRDFIIQIPRQLKSPLNLCSTIEGDELVMKNDFREFSYALPSGSYIVTASASTPDPEIVIVGPPSVSQQFPGTVTFTQPTRGHVDTYARLGSSEGIWLHCINIPTATTHTAEKSFGMKWNSNGDFGYQQGSAEKGLYFYPDYNGSPVSPP